MKIKVLCSQFCLGVVLCFSSFISVAQTAQELQNSLKDAVKPSRFGQNLPSQPAMLDQQDQEKALGSEDKEPIVPRPLTDFQKFVQESIGRVLPIFGESALNRVIRDAKNLPLSADYSIMPGDELVIRAWGGVSIDHRVVVDRNGNIGIPSVGTFSVAGVKARDLEGVLHKQIGVYYKNFNVSATVGFVGGVKVFVSGHALTPGVHLVPASSTLASVAMSVAQPGANGSFRSIQLKRGGNTVTSFDMYSLLKEGLISNDVQLQSGDVVHVGQAGVRVALNTEGPSAAIFEVKPTESLADVIAMSGLAQTLIRQDSILIEGFQPDKPQAPRVTEQLSYSRALSTNLKDGDVVTLFPVRQEFSNAVTLKGNVSYPARYPFFTGMRVSDLIPNNHALIPPSYYEQRNALTRNQLEARKQVQQKSSRDALLFTRPLEDGKVVKKDEMGDERKTLNGNSLNQHQVAELFQPTVEETVKNLLPQVNWEYAVIERLNAEELKPRLITFNLRKALSKDPQDNIELMSNDVVTIFSADDAMIPKSKKVALIKVSGEVNSPGYYQIQPGETLRDVLVKAGGLAPNAFLFGTRLVRKSIQEQQREQLFKALDQAERQLQAAEAANSTSALNSADALNARSVAASQRAYLDKLRTTKPDGRVVMELSSSSKSIVEVPSLELEDGDSVVVPSVPGQVVVLGSVYSPGSFAYQSGRSVYDYLSKAGGASKSSDKDSVFVIRANGKVVSAQQGWIPFVSGLVGESALPGDTIYVPEDYERVSFMKNILNISTVFYQLGLGAAALNAIKD